MVDALTQRLLARIHRQGPLPFSEFVDAALYDPDAGFYARAAGAGRRRDFLTSPELGPLFGAVVARALDHWWAGLDHPDPYVVVEAGAGRGTLARAVLDARPACAAALRYVLVERSAQLRDTQAALLPLELPAFVLGPVPAAGEDDIPAPATGTGPLVTSLSYLPAQPVTGVILANELLDNLGFLLLERGDGGWSEVRVGEESGLLREAQVPAASDLATEADRLAPRTPPGGRIPLQLEARTWLRDALAVVERGHLVVIDYADTTPSLGQRPWRDWLRTYRSHLPGGHPLDDPGQQDVTCEVALDQLARVRPPTSQTTQADFLRAHGLDELVDVGRATWRERAAIGDLEALKARSRVNEGAALTDPAGLGAFTVSEWTVT